MSEKSRQFEELNADQVKELKEKFSLQNDPNLFFAGRVCSVMAVGIVKDAAERAIDGGEEPYSEKVRLGEAGKYAAMTGIILAKALQLPNEEWLRDTFTPLEFWEAAEIIEREDLGEAYSG